MTASLRDQVLKGFAWLAARQAALTGLQLGVGICLSRWLEPRAFGTFSVLLFWTQTLAQLGALGLDGALTRRMKPPSPGEAGTAFALQAAGIGALGLALLWAAPHLGRLYPDLAAADLRMLPWVLAAVLAGAARGILMARLEQAMRFRELARLEWLAGILPQVLVLLMAWRGFGLAALVAGLVAREVLLTAGIWRVSGGIRPAFSAGAARTLVGEGGPFLAASALASANAAALPLYLGTLIGVERMGYVSWAAGQALKPQQLLDAAGRVLYPAYARLQDRLEAVGRSVEASLRLMGAAMLGFAGLMAALAEPLIRLVYGEKWLPAEGALTLYALALLPILLNLVAVKALLALGEAKRVLGISVLTTALLWGVLLACAPEAPLLAAPAALGAANAAGFLMTGWLLSRRIPLGWLRAIRTPLAAGAAGWAVAKAGAALLPGWPGLLAGASLGGLAWLGILALPPDRVLQETWGLLRALRSGRSG